MKTDCNSESLETLSSGVRCGQRYSFCIALFLAVGFLSGGCVHSDPDPAALLARAQVIQKTDTQKALQMTQLAASMGHIPALIALGNYESNGRLLPHVITMSAEFKSDTSGTAWYARARQALIEEGSGNSLFMAASMYRSGRGGPVDRERAFELASEAAKQGFEHSLFIASMWAAKDDDQQRIDQIIGQAREDKLDISYRIESFVSARRDPTDIIGTAAPLAAGEAAGVALAAFELKSLAYNLQVAAERGDAVAAQSIEALKSSGLWRQPEDDFYPNANIAYKTT